MAHGIHHVTAIAGPAARTLAFHTRVLGQRLVKRTVNFDDPGTYHLYYGDAGGAPGSILTVFPWAHAVPGRAGAGEASETRFRVPAGALDFWRRRLEAQSVAVAAPARLFGAPLLRFKDPDGMSLALVGVEGIEREPFWTGGEVPADHAIRGLHGVALTVADPAPTAAVLSDVMGFTRAGEEDGLLRLHVADAAMGGVVDLVAAAGAAPGRQGAGSVHHVAFRARDDAEQAAMARRLREEHRLASTEQKDRAYFRSVYLREPGGIIFEIATDEPGFAADEPASRLGEALKLPPFLEGRRSRIEAVLPELA